MFIMKRFKTQKTCNAAVRAAIIAAVLSLTVFSPAPGASARVGIEEILAEYQNLSIRIDGRTVIPKDAAGATVYPFVYNSRTYMPVRALANALSCDVAWDDAKSVASISTSGSAAPFYGTPATRGYSENVSIEYRNIVVRIDGKQLALDNEPFLFKNSVYLPVREIATGLNCDVAFDTSSNVISINRKNGGVKTAGIENASAKTTGADVAAANANDTKPVDIAGSFSLDDLAFVISKGTVRLDQNISAVKDLLGAPTGYEEVESCAYTGLDKFYTFGKIEISTLPIDGDLICSIDVLDGSASTAKNIAVGGSLAQIEAAYGKDYTYENGVLIYWAGPKGNPKTPQLYFMMDGGDKVDSFGMYNGKSAG